MANKCPSFTLLLSTDGVKPATGSGDEVVAPATLPRVHIASLAGAPRRHRMFVGFAWLVESQALRRLQSDLGSARQRQGYLASIGLLDI